MPELMPTVRGRDPRAKILLLDHSAPPDEYSGLVLLLSSFAGCEDLVTVRRNYLNNGESGSNPFERAMRSLYKSRRVISTEVVCVVFDVGIFVATLIWDGRAVEIRL